MSPVGKDGTRRPYVESRRPRRQAEMKLRMSREERDALHRVAAARGQNVTEYLLAKIARDLRQEMQQ